MVGVADTFPESLPAFQRMFPDDVSCARYLESVRWREGFACPRCAGTAEPMRLGRPHLLRLLGLAMAAEAPTYDELYSENGWDHPGTTCVS